MVTQGGLLHPGIDTKRLKSDHLSLLLPPPFLSLASAECSVGELTSLSSGQWECSGAGVLPFWQGIL